MPKRVGTGAQDAAQKFCREISAARGESFEGCRLAWTALARMMPPAPRPKKLVRSTGKFRARSASLAGVGLCAGARPLWGRVMGVCQGVRMTNTQGFGEWFGMMGRYWAGLDRTGIGNVQWRWRPALVAWAFIAAVYLLGWGVGTVNAFRYLAEPYPLPARSDADVAGMIGGWVTVEVPVIVLSLAGIWLFRQLSRAQPVRAGWARQLRTFFVAFWATAAGFIGLWFVGLAFGQPSSGFPPQDVTGNIMQALNVLDFMMAGPTEELALLALVVVALRSTGHSWWVVAAACVLVRVPFHMFYGWGALAMLVWPVLLMLLYRRTNAIAAIIAEHAVWNWSSSMPAEWSLAVKGIVAITGAVVIVYTLRRDDQRATAAWRTGSAPAGHSR